jgi:hypothetical protein
VASPYLPPQHDYNAPPPTALYKSFATNAGCANPAAPTTTFQCLVSKDTVTLQMAAAEGSASGPYGTWAFIPVIDGTFTRERPTEQLLKRKINGVNILSGVYISYANKENDTDICRVTPMKDLSLSLTILPLKTNSLTL